jgi:hypothetical protein
MDGNKCSKVFPTAFSEETIINVNGYPTYRRRDTGVTHLLKRGQTDYEVDNRWVVPYNPWLSLKCDSHINLEYCTMIVSVRYIFKYCHKGFDCMKVDKKLGTYKQREGQEPTIEWDEITTHLNAWYVSAPEATWRIFQFPLSHRSHNIIRLAVHLPREESVFFMPGQEENAFIRAAMKDTTLTAYFKLNRDDLNARQYFYREIPHPYVFHKKDESTSKK